MDNHQNSLLTDIILKFLLYISRIILVLSLNILPPHNTPSESQCVAHAGLKLTGLLWPPKYRDYRNVQTQSADTPYTNFFLSLLRASQIIKSLGFTVHESL